MYKYISSLLHITYTSYTTNFFKKAPSVERVTVHSEMHLVLDYFLIDFI